MNIKPVLTEKSLQAAQNGVYTFWVLPSFTKGKIREVVGSMFDVKVLKVRTQNYKKLTKKNMRGNIVTKPARKRALVTLKDGKKIDLFDAKK